MTLGDVIKRYRTDNSLSMDAFAKKSGLSKGYIGMLEKNKHPKTGKEIAPSIEIIKKVADAIGRDFNDVFNELDGNVTLLGNNIPAPNNINNKQTIFDDFDRIPLLKSVHYGINNFMQDNVEKYIETSYEDTLYPEQYFWLRPVDDSMSGIGIFENSLLLFIICYDNRIRPGEIALVTIKGENKPLIRRVVYQNDVLFLYPANKNYDPVVFFKEDMCNFEILAYLHMAKTYF